MVANKIMLFLSFHLILFANQLEISAKTFYANEKNGENILTGNVVIKQNKDILKSDKLIIFTNDKRKAIKYVASGNASFEILINDKNYKGRGDEFVYLVAEDIYEINGNAFIEELQSGKKLYGDKISVNRKKNLYKVLSKEDTPARFIFDLEEK